VEPTQLLSSQIASIHSAVITTCPLVRKQAQESFYNKTPPRQNYSSSSSLQDPANSIPHFHSRSVAVLIQHLRPPPNLASRPRQPHLAQEALFHNYINKAISKSTDTSALYVSHTQRKRPQTPAASRAATISHTAETL